MIQPPLRTRKRSVPAVLALVSLGASFLSCASPAVVRKSESPQTKEIPGRGNYEWRSNGGWVRPSRGNWGPPAQMRAESRKAFDAGAYADALSGYLAYKILTWEIPADRDHYYWGALKSASNAVTSANNRVEITTEYEIDQINTNLYEFL